MIIGLGSDLCNIERIQNSLDRFGERFEQRVFTDVSSRASRSSATSQLTSTKGSVPRPSREAGPFFR